MPVWSVGWADPLEEEMTTDSSILPWRIPRTEEPDGLQSKGSKESDTTEQLTHTVSILIPLCHILFIKASHKASLVSRGEMQGSSNY